MAFDPDKYLAEKTPAFDPDAYLASTPAAPAPVEAEKPEDQSIFRQVADVPLQFGTGIAQGVRAITDSFGADNAVSQNIRGVEDYLSGLLSAQAKQDKQEVARIFQEAEGQGLGSQLAAGLRALTVSPVDFLSQGLGTAVPTIAGGLAGAALKGGTLAARAATAASVGTGIGAVSGAGIVKSTIYDEVKRELSALDLPEDLVEERAKLAQEYGGENLDQILLGAGLGGLAAGFGFEKVLSSRILKNVAASNAAESGALRSALFAGAKEGAPEFIQAAQEQIAGNVALQREGFEDIPTMRGVATAAALEGAIGFGLGAGINVALPAQQQQQYDAARANITNEVDREREILLRADEQKKAREFLAALERENQRRLAGQDQQVNIDAEASAARVKAADIAAPNQDEVNELAAPMRGVDVSNDVQFGVAYGQKIARTLGDYFPNFGQFSVTQGEPVPEIEGQPTTITSPKGARIDLAKPTFVVIDSEGKRYGQPLLSFEQANATAYSLNKEVINQNVRGAILNSLETSGQAYDPETTQRLFSYGYRTLNPDANLFSTVAINEAAKTFGPEYAEALSWRQVEALPEVKDRRGRRIGFEYTVQGQQPRVIKGLTKAQEMNKARSQEGKPESNTFDLQETKSALGKSFAAITKDVPIDPKIGKQGAINQIKSLLQSKNVSSEIDSLEINALAKGLTGKNSVNDMDFGDIRLFAKKLGGLPRFEKPVKLPEFVFKPYNRENFVRASKFLQQSNAQGAKPDRDQILEAAGISKEDPKVDEKFSALETDLAKQGVRNEPQKPLALPAPPGGNIDLESLRKALREKLKGFGLQDINLSLERNLIKPTGEIAPAETEAMFIPAMRQVFLAVDRIDPDGSLTPEQRLNALSEVMGHEIIHAVRLLDLWKPTEWSSLEKAVARIQKPGTNQTYLQIAQRNYADQNAVIQIEEAVADMYRDYVGKRLKIAGKPQNLLERLAQFFQRLRSALAGTGFQTYSDVINRLESGVIGARQRGEVRTLRATEEAVAEAGRIPERLRDILATPQGRQQVRQQATQQSVATAQATGNVPATANADFNANLLATAAIRESRSLTDPVPQTIDVDGRNVPTRDSEGRLIYSGYEGPEVFNTPTRPTMDGLRNFWNWFGKSKAVDNSKRPLVYYHGTAADITAFQPKQAGSVFLTRSPRFAEEFSALSQDYMVENFPDFMSDEQVIDVLNETLQRSSAFTPNLYDRIAEARDKAVAEVSAGKAIRPGLLKIFKDTAAGGRSSRYLDAIQKRLPSGANLMPVYVRAEKPWDYDNKDDIKAVVKRARENGADITASMIEEIGQGNWQTIEGSDGNAPILDAIRELGYDSMFVEEGGQKNLAVFNPGQIKSAIGNNGDFSPLTTSIRESRVAKPRQILFEVAPDPNNQSLTEAWRGLDPSVRLTISERVAKNIVPMVLDASGARGTVVGQVGSYLDDTNPSFALMLESGDPLDIAKSIGFALSQDSMMVVAPNKFNGGDVVQSVTVNLGQKSPQEVESIYNSLREIEVDGSKPVGGQTFANGFMTILNYSDVQTDTLADLIDKKLNGGYNVLVTDVYSAFPEKKDYDYASPENDGSGKRANLRKRLRDIRAEATDSVQRELQGISPQGRAAGSAEAALISAVRESRRSPNVVGLMSGEEVPPRKLKGKTQVAQYLQDRALEALGGRTRDLNNEADRDAIADDLVEEAIYEMEAQKNALEWYDTTIERTIELLSLKYPEIKTDQNARTAFLTGLAITSQNIAVPDNLKYAEEVYNYFKRNRRFPEKGFGSKAGSIKRNFEKANMLIDSLGSMQAFTDFLQTEFTVGQLNPILKEHLGKGAKVGGELVGAKVYGSAVFGPKIGNGFYTNLRGDFSPVTIDMWFMRTIGRLRGNVMDFEEAKFGKQLNRLAKSENMEGTSTDELVARATQLAKQHEKDFKQFRSEYDSGVRKKSEATNAAITIVKSLKATRDAPSTGREREQLRDIVNRAINKMRDRTGQDIPPAAFQALIWYPEQDLYKKLGVKLKHVRQDYANSTKQFLRNEGFSERELKRSEDRVRSRRQRRTERVRPGAVAPVEAAVAPTGRRIGETVPGAEAVPLIRESRRPQAQLDQAVANAEADVASTPSMAVPLYNPGASPEALYVAQNPEQGLKLTPEDKIRYSRNNQPQYQPGTQQVLDKLTKDPPAQTPAQTVITSMQMPRFRDSIDKMRQKLIFNYARLEFYNKAHPSLMHNTAAVSSLAAAEFADRSKALFAAAVKGGVPVYKDGGFTIEPFIHNGREYKNGLIDVLAPLYNNQYGVSLEKLAQGYAIARRGERLTREGKLVPGDPGDLQVIQAEIANFTNPETGRPIVEEWYDTWQAYNSNTVKFLRDTGMIDDAGAQLWLSQSDYFPFYRTDKTGKDISHPKVFGGLTSVTNLKALKGGEEAIDVPLMEAILTNLDSAIAMGMKNVAQQRIVRDMITIGLGRMVQPGENIEGRPAVTFKVGGKKYSAFIDDPLIFESMQAVPEVNMDGLLGNLFTAPAKILRELIVREPGYVVANMLRDTASVVLTSGSNIIPVVDTVRNFGRGLENLEKFGVVGGYDFARDPGDVVKFVSDEARKQGHEFPVRENTKWDQVVNSNYIRPLTRVWNGLGKISDMAEASTRNAVYEDTMSRTGNWVQAAYDALSVINYGRRGRNAGLRFITASVPFLNARIQGLDKLYQAGMGRSGIYPERKKNILRFVAHAGLMVVLTGLYYAMISDDELYENENPEVRDNYYIIPIKKADLANREPGFAFKIPIPFEVGILFKTIPERIMDAYYKDAPSKDLKDSLFRATTSTLGFNPVPQVVLPIFETVANYDTFTGRSIIPQYMQDRDPIAQSRFGTNELARRLGEAAGISPLKLDHLMNGYLGSLGTYTLDTVDSVLRDNDRAYPERKWFEYPFVRRFFTTAMRPGLQEQFYELDARVNGVIQSMNTLRKENRVDELQTYIMENQNILALKQGVNVLDKMMKNYRDQKNMVLRMDIDPEEKRRIVDELDRNIALQLKVMPELRRYAYDEQRQARQ